MGKMRQVPANKTPTGAKYRRHVGRLGMICAYWPHQRLCIKDGLLTDTNVDQHLTRAGV
jgi:hypothetical protein